MNHTEERTAALFDSATTGLTPDVARLVSGGVARGRVLRRRRRIGTALATAAVLGVIGTAASVAPGLDLRGGGSTATLAPAPATQASPSQTAEEPAQARRIGLDVDKTGWLLGSLLPAGDVTADRAWHGKGFQAGSVLLDGSKVMVVLESPQPGVAPDPAAACAEAPPGVTCVERASGDWLSLRTSVESEQGGADGVVSSAATVFTVDGFTITATAWNAPDEKGSDPVADEPVLTEQQLREIVLDPVWLDEQQ